MTDIQAAIGREQLKRLPAIVDRRRALAGRYTAALGTCPGIALPHEPAWARSNWQSYAVRVDRRRQREVMQALLDAGIATRRGAMNAHREPAYQPAAWRAPGGLTHSEEAQDRSIVLPLFHQLTEADQDVVIGAVQRAVAGAC
jgi:dTDP-4-amino-4,6-dideoxygalactose transaminase